MAFDLKISQYISQEASSKSNKNWNIASLVPGKDLNAVSLPNPNLDRWLGLMTR